MKSCSCQGRLKSLHSIESKMKRKKVSLAEIYDARALRIVVDDKDGAIISEATSACYQIMVAVKHIWKPIWGESDDYIANPKVLQ